MESFAMNPRFQRNLGILDEESMKRVADTHVLVAGVGGAGGQCAVDLARLGFGWVTLADFDVYEAHNANRQIGSFDSTLGKPKIEIVGSMCRDINPELRIRNVTEGVTESNVGSLLSGFDGKPVDYVVEAIDIVGARAKEQLHQACRQQGIIIMTALMLGFGAALHVFQPEAPLYEDLYILPDGRIDLPKIIPGLGSYVVQEHWDACFAGRGHAPTCIVGATTAAGMMVSEIMRGILLGRDQMVSYPEYLYVDFFDHRYIRGSVASA
ncbi:ThiF family adenylyltransferase [Microbispora siamensis]